MTLDDVIVGAGTSGLMRVVRARLGGNTSDCFGETDLPHGFVERRAIVRDANGGLHTFVCTMIFHELCAKRTSLFVSALPHFGMQAVPLAPTTRRRRAECVTLSKGS